MTRSYKLNWIANRQVTAHEIDWAHGAGRRSFQALYDGVCYTCDDPVVAGQSVRYDSDDNLVHARHTGASLSDHTYIICDSCFLTKPCECEL